MVHRLLLATAAALSLSACAADANMAGGSTALAGDMTPTGRLAYVDLAGASDLFEIQSSQLALTRAQNPAVRDFAQMMIAHHTQTTAQLTAAATASGVTPQPRLLPVQQQMLSQLQGASGSGFDQRYMSQQVRAHEMALALHSTYASNGDTPALRTVAAAATPIVRQHLERARQLD